MNASYPRGQAVIKQLSNPQPFPARPFIHLDAKNQTYEANTRALKHILPFQTYKNRKTSLLIHQS